MGFTPQKINQPKEKQPKTNHWTQAVLTPCTSTILSQPPVRISSLNYCHGPLFGLPGPALDPSIYSQHNQCLVLCCAQSLSRFRFFAIPRTVAHQAPLSMEFSRQEYWSGLTFPTSGDFPYPEIEPESLESHALAGEFLTTETRIPF